MIAIKKIFEKLFGDEYEELEGSSLIYNQKTVADFINKQGNPFLVSFPRTGSHWLRMIMELYFKRPSLIRVFYYPEVTNYLTLHTHDIDLTVERENVIYLYRNPVDTIYSQMNYYKEDTSDSERIAYWADLYGRHLDKWLNHETFTRKKTFITYEGMKCDMEKEFSKITSHFGERLDYKNLAKAVARITKEEVKRKTEDDPQVVQLQSNYADLRKDFREKHGRIILEKVLTERDYLAKINPGWI